MACSQKIDSEKAVERKLVEGVRELGGMAIKMLTDQFSGLPDRLVLLPSGRVLFVELKTTGQKPRKLQVSVHNALRAIGFRVEVVDTIEGVKKLLKEFDL